MKKMKLTYLKASLKGTKIEVYIEDFTKLEMDYQNKRFRELKRLGLRPLVTNLNDDKIVIQHIYSLIRFHTEEEQTQILNKIVGYNFKVLKSSENVNKIDISEIINISKALKSEVE